MGSWLESCRGVYHPTRLTSLTLLQASSDVPVLQASSDAPASTLSASTAGLQADAPASTAPSRTPPHALTPVGVSYLPIDSGPETHPLTPHTESSIPDSSSRAIRDPQYLLGEGRNGGGWGSVFDDMGSSTFYDMNDPTTWYEDRQRGFASEAGGRTPALFLQELVHESSLLTAVAMSTLRNDIEGAPSPLGIHIPGSDFPEVDPDQE